MLLHWLVKDSLSQVVREACITVEYMVNLVVMNPEVGNYLRLFRGSGAQARCVNPSEIFASLDFLVSGSPENGGRKNMSVV